MIVLNRTDDGDLNPQLILRLAERAVAVPTSPQDDVHIQTAVGVAWRNASQSDRRIDTTTPAGRFFFHMMAALAEMERDLIRERTMAGLSAARARGRMGGRRQILSRRQITQARLLLAHPDQTMGGVASALGVSRSTLYRALARSQRPDQS